MSDYPKLRAEISADPRNDLIYSEIAQAMEIDDDPYKWVNSLYWKYTEHYDKGQRDLVDQVLTHVTGYGFNTMLERIEGELS